MDNQPTNKTIPGYVEELILLAFGWVDRVGGRIMGSGYEKGSQVSDKNPEYITTLFSTPLDPTQATKHCATCDSDIELHGRRLVRRIKKSPVRNKKPKKSKSVRVRCMQDIVDSSKPPYPKYSIDPPKRSRMRYKPR